MNGQIRGHESITWEPTFTLGVSGRLVHRSDKYFNKSSFYGDFVNELMCPRDIFYLPYRLDCLLLPSYFIPNIRKIVVDNLSLFYFNAQTFGCFVFTYPTICELISFHFIDFILCIKKKFIFYYCSES